MSSIISEENKELKVGLFINTMAPYKIPLINALAQSSGINLKVYSYIKTEKNREWIIRFNTLKAEHKVLYGFSIKKFHFNPLVPLLILKERFDVIIVGTYIYPAAWLAVLTAKILGIRVISRVGTTIYSEKNTAGKHLTSLLKNIYFRFCDFFLAYGKASKHYLELYGVSYKKIICEGNTVDVDYFIKTSENINEDKNQSEINLLYVGRLLKWKGVIELLDAFYLSLKNTNNIRLTLLGNGPLQEYVEAFIKEKNIEKYVIMHGYIQQDHISYFYKNSDVFVFPSFRDPWGLVVNEAMCFSLPVIVSKFAGCAIDLLKDNYNGYIIDPTNVHVFADKIVKLACAPDLRKKMGNNSKKIIRNYDNQNALNRYREVISLAQSMH